MSERSLSARLYDTLAQAAADTDTLGRMRTSSEIHGDHHLRRGHMLKRLRLLEHVGYIERTGHHWSSGRVTDRGRAVLATATRRPTQNGGANASHDGIHADGGTKFKRMLVHSNDALILSRGEQNKKLGTIVAKGRHKGLPMRAVTLEEGRTCPAECAIRTQCYGGGMPFAKRLSWQGETTGQAIADAIEHSQPALVRLHTLGDFPSLKYARRVLSALLKGGSAAFGFTHHAPETPTGADIREMARKHWDRFSIRTSYRHGTRAPIAERSAVVISRPDQAAEHDAVLCPEQQGQTPSCAECGFCWHSQRPVAFVLHENLRKTGGLGP